MKIFVGLSGFVLGVVIACGLIWTIGYDFDSRGLEAFLASVLSLVLGSFLLVITIDQYNKYKHRDGIERIGNE